MWRAIYLAYGIIGLMGCNPKAPSIDVELRFKANGKFEICFTSVHEEDLKNLEWKVTVNTKTGKTRVREGRYYMNCANESMMQYKLGTYSHEELEEMNTEFVNGNIESAVLDLKYSGRVFKTVDFHDL